MSSTLLDILVVVATTSGCAVALTLLALREGLLDLRPEPRRCPSCGGRLRSWTCSSCTRSSG
jgi:uncharacterized protein with PIN domain